VINLDEDFNFAANSVPASYQSYFVTPSWRANIFAMTAVSPWISAGGRSRTFPSGRSPGIWGPQRREVDHHRRDADRDRSRW
jgi:hypothetical protein